jgi:hypothetical protein
VNAVFERRMRVVSIDESSVGLAAVAACDGCAGCTDRCTGVLSGLGESRPLRVERDRMPGRAILGDELYLRADARGIAGSARSVYGSVLVGLLAGAMCGALLATLLDLPRDPAVALFAVLGVALAARIAGLRSRATPPVFDFAPLPPTVET